MSDYDSQETIPVPRTRIFVLDDGTFVVQWEVNRVQALVNGRYYSYDSERYGNAITDWELNQLKNSGVVDDYDTELVYLSPLPTIAAQIPTRSFYLNTTLPKSKMKEVEELLEKEGLTDKFAVRVQGIFTIIRGRSGRIFITFDEAERAREILLECAPALLRDTVVAFVEINPIP
ncbi:MAG: hypothetical protein Q9P44_05820 [Anaerolineae bacterium]|nr:hypothetical protein [Anaerolineae bacterium]